MEELEEAVLAVLEADGGRAVRPHEDPDTARRVARRILQRLDGMGKWGGYHTDFAHLARGFAGNERALAQEVGEALLEAGLLAEKPSVGQRHVFLNPRRAAEIRKLIDEGRSRRVCASRPRENMRSMPDIGRVAKEVNTKLFTARTLAAAGVLHPGLAEPRGGRRTCACTLRADAGRRLHRLRPALWRRDRVDRRARHADLPRDRRAHQRLAHGLAANGIGEGDNVGLMCRNHRGFVESVVACSKLGANVLFLNTAFSGPQLTDVAQREEPKALIYDYEFEELIHDASRRRKRFIAWHDADEGKPKDPLLEDLAASGDIAPVRPPSERGKAIILTSGTTGTPKGASRSQPKSLDPAAALLAIIPLKAREKTMIAAPTFHSWGFVHFTLGMSLSSTLVLKRKFDPEATLLLIDRHEGTGLSVVPVMMERIMELPKETLKRTPVEAAPRRGVGSACAERCRSAGWTGTATSSTTVTGHRGRGEHRRSGRPARRAGHGRPPAVRHDVRLYDEDGDPIDPGVTGRILVGDETPFEGYTAAEHGRHRRATLVSGDVGRLDETAGCTSTVVTTT